MYNYSKTRHDHRYLDDTDDNQDTDNELDRRTEKAMSKSFIFGAPRHDAARNSKTVSWKKDNLNTVDDGGPLTYSKSRPSTSLSTRQTQRGNKMELPITTSRIKSRSENMNQETSLFKRLSSRVLSLGKGKGTDGSPKNLLTRSQSRNENIRPIGSAGRISRSRPIISASKTHEIIPASTSRTTSRAKTPTEKPITQAIDHYDALGAKYSQLMESFSREIRAGTPIIEPEPEVESVTEDDENPFEINPPTTKQEQRYEVDVEHRQENRGRRHSYHGHQHRHQHIEPEHQYIEPEHQHQHIEPQHHNELTTDEDNNTQSDRSASTKDSKSSVESNKGSESEDHDAASLDMFADEPDDPTTAIIKNSILANKKHRKSHQPSKDRNDNPGNSKAKQVRLQDDEGDDLESQTDGSDASSISIAELNVIHLPLDTTLDDIKDLFPTAVQLKLTLFRDHRESSSKAKFRKDATVKFDDQIQATRAYRKTKHLLFKNQKLIFSFDDEENQLLHNIEIESVVSAGESLASQLPTEKVDKKSMIQDWIQVQSNYYYQSKSKKHF